MPKLAQPTRQYVWKEVIDAVERLGTDEEAFCEICGKRALRWVHILTRNDGRTVEAGCCCAERVCSGVDVRDAESSFRNWIARLQSFVNSPRWKPAKKTGNPTRLHQDARIVICKAKSGWYTFSIHRDGQWENDNGWYQTEREAKIAAFEAFA